MAVFSGATLSANCNGAPSGIRTHKNQLFTRQSRYLIAPSVHNCHDHGGMSFGRTFRPTRPSWRRLVSPLLCNNLSFYERLVGYCLAGKIGLEPITYRLTADCSTIELQTHIDNYKCFTEFHSRFNVERPTIVNCALKSLNPIFFQ